MLVVTDLSCSRTHSHTQGVIKLERTDRRQALNSEKQNKTKKHTYNVYTNTYEGVTIKEKNGGSSSEGVFLAGVWSHIHLEGRVTKNQAKNLVSSWLT